jgi:hypothetical protein
MLAGGDPGGGMHDRSLAVLVRRTTPCWRVVLSVRAAPTRTV